MGTPLDLGELQAARTIEDIPVAVFPAWRSPLKVHIGVFVFLYVLSFAKFQICWPMTWSENFLWSLWNHIPMDNMNKTLAVHALVTLALCYLPGVLAGWLQIYRGTKYSRFPRFVIIIVVYHHYFIYQSLHGHLVCHHFFIDQHRDPRIVTSLVADFWTLGFV